MSGWCRTSEKIGWRKWCEGLAWISDKGIWGSGYRSNIFSDVLCSIRVSYDRRQAYYPPYKYEMGIYTYIRQLAVYMWLNEILVWGFGVLLDSHTFAYSLLFRSTNIEIEGSTDGYLYRRKIGLFIMYTNVSSLVSYTISWWSRRFGSFFGFSGI